jgi:hypothetical protein
MKGTALPQAAMKFETKRAAIYDTGIIRHADRTMAEAMMTAVEAMLPPAVAEIRAVTAACRALFDLRNSLDRSVSAFGIGILCIGILWSNKNRCDIITRCVRHRPN